MEYDFKKIEKDWQGYWAKNKTFKAENKSDKPKYYVLDMFPYPSGAGLHVGHPLGYIASDIIARYKRLKGFNVLHPMGYDSFGLPAEQYAIQTGQHPKITTEQNIKRYREQLDKIGFSFDWDREVRTSDPNYYKWTQWIFIQLFNSWYNPESNKAESIEKLVEKLKVGKFTLKVDGKEKVFDELSEKEKSDVLMDYRLAYLSEAWVNWCPALGTVLANEEVKDGVSERGGHPVERKLMPQWSLRITAYADRLLNDLDTIDWSESLKESQRNWIGKSEGTSLRFKTLDKRHEIEVFTTRPDTIFGVSFLTLAPEHELVEKITTPEHKKAVDEYVTFAKNRSERERQADVKKITGQFTGAYATHPFSGKQIPIWIGDYVLAGYGTGAVMAVPGHDARDYAFAKHFNLPLIEVVSGGDLSKESYDAKEGKLVNSDFLNGLEVKEAIKKAINEIEKKNLGKGKTNYRLRDAIFGRQRYWGEPIPVYYKNGIPCVVEEKDLPVTLPEVDKYLPTETGEPPLARAKDWTYSPTNRTGIWAYPLETTTMPGWAGSSWYFLRYMVQDVKNIKPEDDKFFVDNDSVNYWKDVDLYIGGAEHATGHLLYVRFWTKFLKDLGHIAIDEPAKKLINQGMIQGTSQLAYKLITYSIYPGGKPSTLKLLPANAIPPILVSKGIYEKIITKTLSINEKSYINKTLVDIAQKLYEKFPNSRGEINYDGVYPINVDISIVTNGILNTEAFKNREEYKDTEFIFENDKYLCGNETEKMSKSKFNVVTPDDICEQYGADCLRLYEMFLGPLEQHKPWNTNGITGVFGFLKKLWRLYHSPEGISQEAPTKQELKSLHKTIKKITEDIERFSFNTSVSNFMICVNELTDLKCNKKAILEPLAIIIAPYAPHVAEELWSLLGHTESITYAHFPEHKEEYLVESSFNYPVSVNGKTKFFHELDLSLSKENIEKEVMALEQTQKYLDGKAPKKVIVVPNKIVNIVI